VLLELDVSGPAARVRPRRPCFTVHVEPGVYLAAARVIATLAHASGCQPAEIAPTLLLDGSDCATLQWDHGLAIAQVRIRRDGTLYWTYVERTREYDEDELPETQGGEDEFTLLGNGPLSDARDLDEEALACIVPLLKRMLPESPRGDA
jgi:hypothetical protein